MSTQLDDHSARVDNALLLRLLLGFVVHRQRKGLTTAAEDASTVTDGGTVKEALFEEANDCRTARGDARRVEWQLGMLPAANLIQLLDGLFQEDRVVQQNECLANKE